jgi:hypothetical protein
MKNKSRKARKKQRPSRKRLKVSEMVTEFACDYISMGETLIDRQRYLNTACNAWNIALLQEDEKQTALDQCQKQYESNNPESNDSQNMRHDMEILIQKRLRLLPEVKTTIVGAELTSIEGRDLIRIFSHKDLSRK